MTRQRATGGPDTVPRSERSALWWGRRRGAAMGLASSAAYGAQATLVGVVGGLLPSEAQGLGRAALRVVLGTSTAVVATGCAAVVYLVLWRHWRRRGWWSREGVRVAVCGALVWGTLALAQMVTTVAHLVASAGRDGDQVMSSATSGAPLVLVLTTPVVVFTVAFGRCARQYQRDGLWGTPAPQAAAVPRRSGTWRV